MIDIGHNAPLAYLFVRAEALGHRVDERRAPRSGDISRDVVRVHDDDSADAAELDAAGADSLTHVIAFELGYGMLRRPNPERYPTRSFRVDVPFLRVRVVVRVNLQFCAVNVDSAALDIEYRADLSRERPAIAFPYTGQSEAFRRY